ncbi:hypothetical protein QBC43DRAFT_82651 [Cladorrhinum sp. PSN259]|nr:hypothetical protein QBC43DRAFT_82651 [Cladorrhinum sp. PSN259]
MGSSIPAAGKDKIILYHYPFSPYARRVTWYLRLRQIPYYECIQPPILPRPDLTSLGISYRRIPLLSHNASVYLDTRLILSHLESSPSLLSSGYKPLGSTPGTSAHGLQSLLSTLTTSTDIFFRAATLLPPNLPLMQDKNFLRDRRDFFPQPGEKGEIVDYPLARAEALSAIRDVMHMLESTLLADGRDWILGTETPSLADVEAVWPLHWVLSAKQGIQGAIYDDEAVNPTKYPKVYGWVERFEGYVFGLPDVVIGKLKGDEARKMILACEKEEEEDAAGTKYKVDGTEPVVKALELKKGEEVEVWPTDSGSSHRDKGKLVGIDGREVVWESAGGVLVHAPRVGFRVGKGKVSGKL